MPGRDVYLDGLLGVLIGSVWFLSPEWIATRGREGFERQTPGTISQALSKP